MKRKSRKGIPLGKFYTIFYMTEPNYNKMLTKRVRAESAEAAKEKFVERFEMKEHLIINKVEWDVR